MRTFFEAIQLILSAQLRNSGHGLVDATFAKQRIMRRIGRDPSRAVDDDYLRGRWNYLADLQEMARYAVIGGYCRHSGNVSTVLDLGCGTGILRRWLPKEEFSYVGVDISNLAIEAARRDWTDTGTTFVAMDAASFRPDCKFDAIIFNEVLYYFEHPAEVLTSFAAFLEKNGRFVISLWDSADSRLAWRRSRGSLEVVDEVHIRHGSGLCWHIRLCKPRVRA
jgi:2-polyprenyl-6-hydroxyphenyl methylase/3-demethylubiquinone-9 3-methyltransferase